MKRKKLLAIPVMMYAIALIFISGSTWGYSNGAGDDNLEYGQGSSCHDSIGSGTISATASTLNPTTGQSLTVTVNVQAPEMEANKKVGVFLVRVLQPSNSLPSVDGWIILSDPNGGNNNYVEKIAATPGEQVSFTWTLKAPTAMGSYSLFARAHHGSTGSDILYLEYTGGLTFNVIASVAGRPEINHQPPQDVRPNTQILINATISNATSATLSWKNNAMTTPVLVNMTNSSTPHNNGWIFLAVIPAQSSPTQINYEINATGITGFFTESSYSLSISESGTQGDISDEQQTIWVLSVVTILVLIAGIIIVVYILIGQKLKKGS